MFRILADGGKRNLVRTECALDWHTINFFRACPALRSAQDDHRPRLLMLVFTCPSLSGPGILLNISYARVAAIESTREQLVHDFGIVAFNEIRCVAKPFVKGDKFCITRASRDRGAGDLVTIEVQNRQHRSISRWIQELDALPA